MACLHEVVVNDRIVPNGLKGKLGREQQLGATQQRSDGSIKNHSVGITESCIFVFSSVTLHMSQDMTDLFKNFGIFLVN